MSKTITAETPAVPPVKDAALRDALLGDDEEEGPMPTGADGEETSSKSEDGDKKKEEEEDVPSDPAERWRRAIKNADITEAKANRILDDMAFKGYYEEEIPLMNKRILVTLRTRDSAQRTRVIHALDILQNPTQAAAWEIGSRYNLAASLVKYAPRGQKVSTLPHAKKGDDGDKIEKMFRERLSFVDVEIPDVVILVLFQTLARFDKTVAAALSEGAAEGF